MLDNLFILYFQIKLDRMKNFYLLLISIVSVSFSCFSQGFLKNKGIKSFMEGNPAISTNFKDVVMEGTMPPDFGADAIYVDLKKMSRNNEGYLLLPGFYESTNFSYCLKAGTPGPNVSDGYGPAPLKGKMEDIVLAILENSQKRWAIKNADSVEKNNLLSEAVKGAGKISQRDVQLLLWAIIAKVDFTNLAGRSKVVALAMLTPEEILKLSGGAFKGGSKFLMDKGIISKPAPVRLMEEAGEKLRSLYNKADATYEDFEQVAMLAGLSDQPQIAPNRTWFKHPKECYYIRYEPQGYARTKIQIYVPPGCSNTLFKATGYVATPDDSRQRLAQTDWFVSDQPD